jgi:hypothetical protein
MLEFATRYYLNQSKMTSSALSNLDANLVPVTPKLPAEFERLKIEEGSAFDHYSSDLEELRTRLVTYFTQLGNSAEMSQLFAEWVVKFHATTLKSTGNEAAWLCLRATRPMDNWKIPRWHQDGKYYKGTNAMYKVVFTIKGPSTLFANPTKEHREQINELQDAQNLLDGNLSDPTDRQKQLAEDMKAAQKATPDNFRMGFRKLMADRVQLEPLSVSSTEAVKYRVGDTERAVFHSEPDMTTDRLFLQMLLGTQNNINEWRDKCLSRET